MKLILKTPVILQIDDILETQLDQLKKILTFKDKSIEQQIKQLKNQIYYSNKYGSPWVNKRIDELKEQLFKCLLFEDKDGYWTYSGLRKTIEGWFGELEFQNNVEYSDFKLIPWNKRPAYEPYNYQKKAVELMISNPHSHIECATGLGKSFIAMLLIKETGLPTVIATPSVNIAKQFYKECVEYFGKKNVGLFGGGKREIGKNILISVAKSLSLEMSEEDKNKFKKYQVFCSDESHLNGADTLAEFCTTLLAHCPYRWFFSATQQRNDGKDLLLEGIIGPRVFEYSIQDGIKDSYLAKLSSLIFNVPSYDDFSSPNIIQMNQHHIYNNPKILEIVTDLMKKAMNNGIPTLVLIDEHIQERLIKEKVGNIYSYAKGGSDTNKICEDFNNGKIMCVVGTSAVSTGTNFKPVQLTINWCAGKSSIKNKQGAIGRSTRIDPKSGKKECKIVDFCVYNIESLKRHAYFRISNYEDVGPVTYMDIK